MTDETRKAIDISFSIETTLLGAIRIVGRLFRTAWDYLFFPSYFHIQTSLSSPTEKKDLECRSHMSCYRSRRRAAIGAIYAYSGIFDEIAASSQAVATPYERLEEVLEKFPLANWVVEAVTELEITKLLALIFPYLLGIAAGALAIVYTAAIFKARIGFVDCLAVCSYAMGTFNIAFVCIFCALMALMNRLFDPSMAEASDIVQYAGLAMALQFLLLVMMLLVWKHFFHYLRRTMRVSRSRVIAVVGVPFVVLGMVGKGLIWALS